LSLLKELAGHPEYVALVKRAKGSRPQLPPWSIDQANGQDNTDDWKQKSAMQQGFDLAMEIFCPGWTSNQ
jgi:hypothetical protein